MHIHSYANTYANKMQINPLPRNHHPSHGIPTNLVEKPSQKMATFLGKCTTRGTHTNNLINLGSPNLAGKITWMEEWTGKICMQIMYHHHYAPIRMYKRSSKPSNPHQSPDNERSYLNYFLLLTNSAKMKPAVAIFAIFLIFATTCHASYAPYVRPGHTWGGWSVATPVQQQPQPVACFYQNRYCQGKHFKFLVYLVIKLSPKKFNVVSTTLI